MTIQIHSTANVEESVALGDGTSVWNLARVVGDAQVGEHCVIGQGVYIGDACRVGSRCKIQNYALVYGPSELHDGVFIGPGVVLTNDHYPRAINVDGSRKTPDDWQVVGVRVLEGASIGARSVCVAPVTIGAWAMVAAGSVVTRDVPDFALVMGVPAKFHTWVGRAGRPLESSDNKVFMCPETNERYELNNGSQLQLVESK